jgi:predicted transcriptional regulator
MGSYNLDYKTVLRRLDEHRLSGKSRFESADVAQFLQISIAQASKYVSRLHKMGFMKRNRNKRLCLSKYGKPCNKGYSYTYEFSRQGNQYIKWMSNIMPSELMIYNKFLEDVLPSLSNQTREKIVISLTTRENSRYKGPNRALQTLGNLIYAFPSIAKELGDSIKEKEKLEIENELLNDKIKKFQSETKKLKNKINELEKDIYINKKKVEQFSIEFSQIMLLVKEIQFEEDAANKLNSLVFNKIISDLSDALIFASPEGGPQIVKLISERYAKEKLAVKEHLENANKINGELRKLIAKMS